MLLNHTHYVADVRWKQGEKEALQWLGSEEKSRLMPLIEIIPRNFRTSDGKPLPVRDALRTIARDIENYWGSNAAFVDLDHALSAHLVLNNF